MLPESEMRMSPALPSSSVKATIWRRRRLPACSWHARCAAQPGPSRAVLIDQDALAELTEHVEQRQIGVLNTTPGPQAGRNLSRRRLDTHARWRALPPESWPAFAPHRQTCHPQASMCFLVEMSVGILYARNSLCYAGRLSRLGLF